MKAKTSGKQFRCVTSLPRNAVRRLSKRLNLSEGTVRNYVSEAISKLGASNRVEAARLERNKGWL